MTWLLVPLGELGKVVTGATPKTSEADFYGGDIPFVTPAELDQQNPIVSTPRTLTAEGASQVRSIPAGAVMVCCIGSLGKVGIAGRELVTNQQINSIVFHPNRVWPRYGYYACRLLKPKLEAMAPATTVAIVNKSKFEALPVPLPPLEEQRRIAAILDAADSLRAKRRAALAKLEQLAQSIFIDMFGRGDAPARTIQELLDDSILLVHKDGNHGSQYPRADEFGAEGIPFISAQSIDDVGSIQIEQIQYLNPEKATKLKIGWIEKGDILLAHNASVGKVGFYSGLFPQALIGTSLTAFRPDQKHLTSEYLFAALRATGFQAALTKNMSQTTRNQVPITAQRQLSIPVPNMELQQDFAARVATLQLNHQTQKKSLSQMDNLFDTLQHRAFRGEL
jgi:type I restriction enzyme S subunit